MIIDRKQLLLDYMNRYLDFINNDWDYLFEMAEANEVARLSLKAVLNDKSSKITPKPLFKPFRPLKAMTGRRGSRK